MHLRLRLMQRRSISQNWLSMKSKKALAHSEQGSYTGLSGNHHRCDRFFRNPQERGDFIDGHRPQVMKGQNDPLFLGQLRQSASQGQGRGHSPKVTRVGEVMWLGEPVRFELRPIEMAQPIGKVSEDSQSSLTNQILFCFRSLAITQMIQFL